MKHKLLLPLLCLPLLTGCSYLFSSKEQKTFKTDSPPAQDRAEMRKTQTQESQSEEKDILKKEKRDTPKIHSEENQQSPMGSLANGTNSSAYASERLNQTPEEVISGNQPTHHIGTLNEPDSTSMEDRSNVSLQTVGGASGESAENASAPSARQQERQAAIKLRDSLERIQNGRTNNSEEDRQLSELPASQRKAMLEQLNQALSLRNARG